MGWRIVVNHGVCSCSGVRYKYRYVELWISKRETRKGNGDYRVCGIGNNVRCFRDYGKFSEVSGGSLYWTYRVTHKFVPKLDASQIWTSCAQFGFSRSLEILCWLILWRWSRIWSPLDAKSFSFWDFHILIFSD